jgi:hypothetical protein
VLIGERENVRRLVGYHPGSPGHFEIEARPVRRARRLGSSNRDRLTVLLLILGQQRFITHLAASMRMTDVRGLELSPIRAPLDNRDRTLGSP